MGMINIQMYGSFPKKEKSFGAIEYGHAHAINEAIAWLSEQMKAAINSDHQLHDDGAKPNNGFTKP